MPERIISLDLFTLIFCLTYAIYSNLLKTTAFSARVTYTGAMFSDRRFIPEPLIHIPYLLETGCHIQSLYQTLCSAVEGDEDDRGSGRVLATQLVWLNQYRYIAVFLLARTESKTGAQGLCPFFS